MKKKDHSFSRASIVVLISMVSFFSTLFANYTSEVLRSHLAAGKQNVKSIFVPMQKAFVELKDCQSELELSHIEMLNVLRAMKNEIDLYGNGAKQVDDSAIEAQDILIKTQLELMNRDKELREAIKDKENEVIVLAEELSIVSGVYDEFTKISTERQLEIDKVSIEFRSTITKTAASVGIHGVSSSVSLFKKSRTLSTSSEVEAKRFINTFWGSSMKLYDENRAYVRKISEIDRDFYRRVKALCLLEIKKAYSNGVIGGVVKFLGF